MRMMVAVSAEDQTRITELQAQLDNLRKVEKKILDELRSLIYKIEKVN